MGSTLVHSADSILKLARDIARILCGAGYAVLSFVPSRTRGWSAKRRTGSFRLAAHLAMCGRLSALHGGFSVLGSAFPGFRSFFPLLSHRASSPRLVALRPVAEDMDGPVQRAPRGGVVVPPDRVPRPPGWMRARHPRGRRIDAAPTLPLQGRVKARPSPRSGKNRPLPAWLRGFR